MRLIRNIGLIFVVSLLILATGGFSVYQHVCHCAGEMKTSIFKEDNCEHQRTVSVPDCCSVKETKSCCEIPTAPVKESRHTCHKDDCCQTTSLFLKISDSYQPGIEKVTLKSVQIVSAVLSIDLSEDILFTYHINICNSDLPPPDTGKQIVTALHQLKLDQHLV